MVLVKDGRTITLTDQTHIDAFRANGWVEEKKTVEETPVEATAESETAAPPTAKRGRPKKREE